MRDMAKAGCAGVVERMERLSTAFEACGDLVNPFIVARARVLLRRAGERFEAGAEVTVAALLGGSGSGKSSLFNALTGLRFADVSDVRPTTRVPSACYWNVEATGILDMLEVPASRRIAHDSVLVDDDGALDSLVLIDFPDHDSYRLENTALMERILPLVDVLIWVVDPQKYADQLLHGAYLEALHGRRDATMIVVNHVDALPAGRLELLINDVKKKLAADGLPDVPVVPASARSGYGIGEIKERIAAFVAQEDIASTTAAADLDTLRRRLQRELGEAEAPLTGEAVREAEERIASAMGIPAVAAALRSRRGAPIPTLENAPTAMTTAIRDSWIAHARAGLPPLWQKAVEEAVPPVDRLRRAIAAGLRGVATPSSAPFGRTKREALASRYETDARQAIAAVVDEMLVEPAREILDRHRTAREVLECF